MREPWVCLCCGLDSDSQGKTLSKTREEIELFFRHHVETCPERADELLGEVEVRDLLLHHVSCPERALTTDSAETRDLKARLASCCDRFNAQHIRAMRLHVKVDELMDEVQALQTFYAAINTPECPYCDSETVFLAEAFAKENIHYYRCRECKRQFSRGPLVS